MHQNLTQINFDPKILSQNLTQNLNQNLAQLKPILTKILTQAHYNEF